MPSVSLGLILLGVGRDFEVVFATSHAGRNLTEASTTWGHASL